MKYKEIYNEYVSLIKEKTDNQIVLNSLKNGYISQKTISGNNYSYLQHRVDGSLVSEYIRKYDLPEVKAELSERTRITKNINDINNKLKTLEAAAKILDKALYRKLINVRRCAVMELMSSDKRFKALAFCRAMTALEGISVSSDTDKNLSSWAKGEATFREGYIKTLQMFNLAEG